MKLNKFFRAFIYTCFLLTSSTVVFGQSEDSKKLIALQRRHFEAMIHRDTLLLSSLLADSLVYIHSSGVIDDKKSFLRDIASGRIEYLFILPEKVIATVDGSYGWIYGRANIRFRLASMIGTIDQYVSFIEVYRMKKFQWQLVLCHNARIEPNAPYVNNFVPQVKGGSMPSIY